MVVHSEVGMDSEGSGHRMLGDTTVEVFAYIYLLIFISNEPFNIPNDVKRKTTDECLFEKARKKEEILVPSEILSQHLPSFPPFFPLFSFLRFCLGSFATTFSFSHFPFRTIFGTPYSFLPFIN
jgi:hypothetical protein